VLPVTADSEAGVITVVWTGVDAVATVGDAAASSIALSLGFSTSQAAQRHSRPASGPGRALLYARRSSRCCNVDRSNAFAAGHVNPLAEIGTDPGLTVGCNLMSRSYRHAIRAWLWHRQLDIVGKANA